MGQNSIIKICGLEGQKLNGLGNMILQFMQQEFGALEYKARAARKIKCKMSMEVEGGISVTISFEGDRILVENGVADRPDLYMAGSYLLMTDIICGKVSPVFEVLKGNIKNEIDPAKAHSGVQGFGDIKARSRG